MNPGEVVALVGPSGGGKSSCVNLLEHFYEVQSGKVLLDDRPINDYNHKYLHRKVSENDAAKFNNDIATKKFTVFASGMTSVPIYDRMGNN